MSALYTLELEGEVLQASHDKNQIREAGQNIAQKALLQPPVNVGSATIVGLNRGGHLSWELEEVSGHILELRVNKITEEEPKFSELSRDSNTTPEVTGGT